MGSFWIKKCESTRNAYLLFHGQGGVSRSSCSYWVDTDSYHISCASLLLPCTYGMCIIRTQSFGTIKLTQKKKKKGWPIPVAVFMGTVSAVVMFWPSSAQLKSPGLGSASGARAYQECKPGCEPSKALSQAQALGLSWGSVLQKILWLYTTDFQTRNHHHLHHALGHPHISTSSSPFPNAETSTLKNWSASALRRLSCLLIVFPADKKARSLETDDAMMGR